MKHLNVEEIFSPMTFPTIFETTGQGVWAEESLASPVETVGCDWCTWGQAPPD